MKNEKTQKEYYGEIKDILIEADRQDLVEFVNKRIEQLVNKNAKKSAKENKEVEELKSILLEELAKVNKTIMVTELLNTSEVLKNYVLENGMKLTSQKVTPILTKLIDEGKVVNVKDKKKSFYSIVKEKAEEEQEQEN